MYPCIIKHSLKDSKGAFPLPPHLTQMYIALPTVTNFQGTPSKYLILPQKRGYTGLWEGKDI
jgi:hypothetical protein